MNKEDIKCELIAKIVEIERENLTIEPTKLKKASVDSIYKEIKDMEVDYEN